MACHRPIAPFHYNITQSFFNLASLFLFFFQNIQRVCTSRRWIRAGDNAAELYCDKLSLGEVALSRTMRGNLFPWLFAAVVLVWIRPVHLPACLLGLPLHGPLLPHLTRFNSIRPAWAETLHFVTIKSRPVVHLVQVIHSLQPYSMWTKFALFY